MKKYVMEEKLCQSWLNILKRSNNNIKIKSALGDGSYDSNENFKYLLEKKRIRPGIKVRKNSIISLKNNSLRNREVYSQSKDLLKWKKSRKYGSRWIAETVFSSYKENLGTICICNKISKYDKRDDFKSIIV